MSDAASVDSRQRYTQIRRQRFLRGSNTLVWCVLAGQVLFSAFAFGHSLGPRPLSIIEMTGGMVLALVLSLLAAIFAVRRRILRDAALVVSLKEGRHPRRVALFDDHLTVDYEIVLLELIDSVIKEERALVLRYADPRFDGALLRELAGDPQPIEKLHSALESATG